MNSNRQKIVKEFPFWETIIFHKGRRTFERETGKYGPIIGFHGVGGWWPNGSFQDYMDRKDVKGILNYSGMLTNGLERQFKIYEKCIKKYPNPVLLGCSASGLGLLLWLERTNSWNKIKSFIALGVPLNGVNWNKPYAGKAIKKLLHVNVAKYMPVFGRTFQDIAVNSPLIEEISKIKPPKSKVKSFFSYEDEWFPDLGMIDKKWNPTAFHAGDHGWHPRYKWIEKVLDSELGIK